MQNNILLKIFLIFISKDLKIEFLLIIRNTLLKMLSFQIASDLHIEYNNEKVPNPLKYITPSKDILILPGDIGSLYKIEQLEEFMKQLCKHFKIVLYIPGNHEWYRQKNYKPLHMSILQKRLKDIENNINNLYVLNRSSVCIDNICISGVTLWTQPKCNIPQFIVRIENMNTKEYTKLHNEDLKYVKKMMRYCKQKNLKLIIVSHHPPTEQVLKNAKKRKQYESLYATDLDYLLTSNYIHTWICGHTHSNFDFISKNGTRIVSNQKGKDKDNITDYSKKFILEI